MDARADVVRLIAETGLVTSEKAEELLEVPPDTKLGDYAFPCFSLAKEMKKAPAAIASEMAALARPENSQSISSAKAMGPYVNFYIDKDKLARSILGEIFRRKDCFGSGKPQDVQYMIEYCQANTHKAFHVGHLRGTSIGEALARILKFNGYNVLQANYQGDTGAHVAKWLWMYLKAHEGEEPPQDDKGKWIASIYVEAVKTLAEHPEFQAEVDKVNYDLEHDADPALSKIWEASRQWSLDEFSQIYSDLNAHFDYFFFEREMEKEGREISQELLAKGIAKKSDDAIIMDLEEYDLGIWVLLRKDGTTLYSAKDLALAKRKFEQFHVDKSIYVVGNAQAMHFRQLFKTLELMGFKQAKDCFHLSFEEVRLPTGKMSSRTGVNILYSEMKDEIFDYTENETRSRHPEWTSDKVKSSAKRIAVAALKFDMLKMDSNKPIIFDTKKACEFEGETGPYIQYAHARICSILRQAPKANMQPESAAFTNEKETALVKLLSAFRDKVSDASDQYRPSIIARYALELAQAFNEFYQECPVLKAEDEKTVSSRLALITATRQVLQNALGLLGIEAPEEM